MNLSLYTLIHTLIDLVNKGERSLSELGERHEIHDSRQSAFLSTKCVRKSISDPLITSFEPLTPPD